MDSRSQYLASGTAERVQSEMLQTTPLRTVSSRSPIPDLQPAAPSAHSSNPSPQPPVSVCHIVSGDLWAGAEAQVAALLRTLARHQACQLSAILFNEGQLAREIGSCGIEMEVIPESQSSFAGLVTKATAFLGSRRVQVLHSHGYKENLLAAIVAWRCRIPVVVRTQHGADEPFTGVKALKQHALQQIDGLVARYATDCIISVSSDLEHRLARAVSPGKIAWIPNGLDTRAASSLLNVNEAKKRLNIPAARPVVGYAGRLVPIKRLDIFIAAAREIRTRFPDAMFLIAGDGSELQSLRQSAQAAGLEDRCLFTGHREDIYDVLRAFDVFVLTSDHEGLPIVLLEALNLGVPVVARAVGGIPEVVENGVSGLLVDSADPRAIADACMPLIADGQLRASMACAGRLRVAQQFSVERTASATNELYRRLVEKRE